MHLSDDTLHVLDYLNGIAEEGLRKRNDLGTLLELAAEREDHETMNALAFHGRHLYGLYSSLRRAVRTDMGRERLEQEFTTAADTLRDRIAALLLDADEEILTRFNEIYYTMSQGSLRNLVDLAHDLGVLKGVQNESKRGGTEPEVG